MRITSNLLFGFVAAMWVVLLIGMTGDPGDTGATFGGGLLITAIPFLVALVLRRAGNQRGIAT
jgi:predicted Na+-dependent transporter